MFGADLGHRSHWSEHNNAWFTGYIRSEILIDYSSLGLKRRRMAEVRCSHSFDHNPDVRHVKSSRPRVYADVVARFEAPNDVTVDRFARNVTDVPFRWTYPGKKA